MDKVEVAVASEDILGESPIWCPDGHALFWVDIRAPALRRFSPASGAVQSWPMPELCAGVTRSRPGSMALSLQSGLFAFDLANAALTPLVAPEPASAGNRLNDPDAGMIGAERTVVEAGALPGRPDGATVDADGCIWNARYEGACVARITPDGRVDRTIALPAENVTACAFGGPELRTLYVTTARQRLDAEALARQPLAGSLFAIDVGVSGLPEPRFEPVQRLS